MESCAPVLFLIFKRPDTTQRVFNAIRDAKPKQLFIAADGPRSGNEDDEVKCAETREIVERVDWECEVKTLFRKDNLGCGRAVSEAITWFFENVEEGIILEDDCLPNQSFFDFMTLMLIYHKQDSRVYHISGFSWVTDNESNDDYFFMRYPNIWGWATWNDRWNMYHYSLSEISERKVESELSKLDLTKEEMYFQKMTFKETAKGNVDTWDYQWKFTCFFNNGLCITPKFCLVENIGNVLGATRNINLEKALPPKEVLINEIERMEPIVDLNFENTHRQTYIWPKANYFYTLKSLRHRFKTSIFKLNSLFK